MSQARSLWRLDLIRTKWCGGFINWGYPLRIQHITTGRYLGVKDIGDDKDNKDNKDNKESKEAKAISKDICLLSREEATSKSFLFCFKY